MPQFKNVYAKSANDVWPSVRSAESLRRIAAGGAAPSAEDLRSLFQPPGGSGPWGALAPLPLTRGGEDPRLSRDQRNLLREYRWHPPLAFPSALDWGGDVATERNATYYREGGFVCGAARHHASSLVVCDASARGAVEEVGGEVHRLKSSRDATSRATVDVNPRFLTDIGNLVRIARGKLAGAPGGTIVQRADAAAAEACRSVLGDEALAPSLAGHLMEALERENSARPGANPIADDVARWCDASRERMRPIFDRIREKEKAAADKMIFDSWRRSAVSKCPILPAGQCVRLAVTAFGEAAVQSAQEEDRRRFLEATRGMLAMVPNCTREWFACGAPARAELKTSSTSQRRLHVRYSEQVFVVTRCRRLNEDGDPAAAADVSRLEGGDAERLTREDLSRRAVEPPQAARCTSHRQALTVEDVIEAKRHVYELAVLGDAVEDPRRDRSLLVYTGDDRRRKQQYQRSQLLAIPAPSATDASRRGFRNVPDLRNSVAQ